MYSYWYICQIHKSWERPFIKPFHGFLDSTIALPGVLFENGKVHGVYEIGKEDWTKITLLVAVVQYDFLTRVRVGRKGREEILEFCWTGASIKEEYGRQKLSAAVQNSEGQSQLFEYRCINHGGTF
jgi:hypothetical protein